MYQYRQVLVRMRQGDTDREIARAGLMGRPKAARLRGLAASQGWLEPEAALPEDAAIAAVIGEARRARSTISSVESYRGLIERWAASGVSGVVIHAALAREHGYRGSASSVYRMLTALGASRPPEATVPLTFAPGEAAQVDFGAGPVLLDPAIGAPRRTWCFVMTLCWSRHQYVEFVWDQSVATWRGCHRRAFEWVGGGRARLISVDPRGASTSAWVEAPLVGGA
jgi:transposase